MGHIDLIMDENRHKNYPTNKIEFAIIASWL
jgi:hypothetical protein